LPRFYPICKQAGPYSSELDALDGYKFKASNARDRNFSRAKLKDRLQEIDEHPYGAMKRSMNQGYFPMQGLEKVQAEISLTVTACNPKRLFNILGVKRMVQPRRVGPGAMA
jgi:hypothetical protein